MSPNSRSHEFQCGRTLSIKSSGQIIRPVIATCRTIVMTNGSMNLLYGTARSALAICACRYRSYCALTCFRPPLWFVTLTCRDDAVVVSQFENNCP
jgi:hypothetical protein